jgi:hypothetical protein
MRLFIIFSLIGLVSCGGDSSQSNKVDVLFSDNAVSHFSQTSGIAKVQKTPLDLIISSAIAGGGNISCITGESVGFTMDAMGNTVNINSTCSYEVGADIRRGLLKSMDGLKLRRTVTEASYNGNDAILDFSGGFLWDTAYTVPRNAGLPCVETYTFHRTSGTISVAASDQSAVDTSGTHGQLCGGAFTDTVSFRFSNGYLELDLSNSQNFTISRTYSDGGNYPSYERFELCDGTNTISTDALPTDIGDDNTNFQAIRDAVATTGNIVTCN